MTDPLHHLQPAELSKLAHCAKRGYERTKKGRRDFLAGTFALAAALRKAREALPADREFADWLNEAGLRAISKDDRAALICIGENDKEARQYFKKRDAAWSWRSCAERIRLVSQAAKPAMRNLNSSNISLNIRSEPAKVAHYKLVHDPPDHAAVPVDEPTHEPLDTFPDVGLQKAISAVEAIIEASSLATTVLASYWRASDDRPSSDQILEAAQWLEALVAALETNKETLQEFEHGKL
jgi:hypothetical protein